MNETPAYRTVTAIAGLVSSHPTLRMRSCASESTMSGPTFVHALAPWVSIVTKLQMSKAERIDIQSLHCAWYFSNHLGSSMKKTLLSRIIELLSPSRPWVFRQKTSHRNAFILTGPTPRMRTWSPSAIVSILRIFFIASQNSLT